MGKRHLSRITALKILYSLDIKEELNSDLNNIIKQFKQEFDVEEITSFTEELLSGIILNLKKIDELIAKTSKHWKMNRMSVIDRNILRVGTWELLNNEPAAIVINEAILTAGEYGNNNSSSFINGVLDNIKKLLDLNES